MLYNKLEEKLGIDCNIGDKVWICDYRFNEIDEKPIRHVQPMEVFIVSNTELPKNKKVYYSEFHFRPVGKNGKATSRIIAPYDNTGYRLYPGVSLNIFFSKKECRDFYRSQCEENIGKLEEGKIKAINYFDAKIKELMGEIETNK